MKGILFGELHSYRDLKLILIEKEIGAPLVKTKLIEIEGADGSIDLTDFFGEPKYGDVTHKFTFNTIVPWNDFLSQYSTVKNALHGKKLRIILDDDPSYYYVGRCYVSSFTNEKNIGTISVECVCEPYKYKAERTVITMAVNGTVDVVLTNSRKRAVPTITTNAPMTFIFGEHSVSNTIGTFVIPELELTEGDNIITLSGNGTVSFVWQEGAL